MNFEIRPYRKSDKAMLLDISRHTWGGYDHLPIVFNKMAADLACHIYVIEYKKRVVALGILRIVENGRTGWMEGLRIRPRYKRRGLAMLLTEYIVNWAKASGLKRLRLLTETDDKVLQKFPRKIGMSKLLTMNYLWKENMPNITWKADPFAIHETDPDTVFNLLQRTPNLVPLNLVFYDWYALDLTRANLRDLSKAVRFWIGTRAGKTVSLALGLRTADQHAQKWCCTIYAADRTAFISALYFQMQIMGKKRLTNLLCIHPAKFTIAFKQVRTLPKRTYLMKFGLFEKKLSKEKPAFP
jgi:GNAT superfamily N-acetyltransferase